MKTLALILMLIPAACGAAEIDYLKINMMQPRALILQKMDGIAGMSNYVKAVETKIHSSLSKVDSMPVWGYLVIAVRQDGKIKSWIDSDEEISPVVQQIMQDAAKSTRAFHVKAGAVIFALGFGINGADIPPEIMPFPDEWKKVSQCQAEECKNQNAEEIVLTDMARDRP